MSDALSRIRVAIALRDLREKPKAIVDALQSPAQPGNRAQFLDYCRHRRDGRVAVARLRSRPAVGSLDAGHAWDAAGRMLDDCDRYGITPLATGDPRFPKRLTALQARERAGGVSLGGYCPILYCKGCVEALNQDRAVAIIGTREPTSFGRRQAREFGRELGAEGIAIVSGLARGCDTEAHVGCVDDASGIGVAVMAHGLDRVYPPENESLAERLIDRRGCLVSEYPPGVPPTRRAFGFRDRIQAALADLIVVIETPAEDGTMLTVGFARKQRRRIACLSHPRSLSNRTRVAGNEQLLAGHGVTPLRVPQDALEAIHSADNGRVAPQPFSSGSLPF